MPPDVLSYYDRNTPNFLRFGGSTRTTGAMHRAVKLPASRNAAGRQDGVNAMLLRVLRDSGVFETAYPSLLDLGCGVGGTIRWIRDTTEVTAGGITLSPVQAEVAARRLPRIVTGSFTVRGDLAKVLGGRPIDAAWMIESFVHTDDVDALFAAVAAHTAPGGVLVIIDDFPRHTPGSREVQASRLDRRLVAEFRRGWHIHTLLSPTEAAAVAARHGWTLERSLDLTSSVRTNRPRDVLARAFAPLARLLGARSAWWQNVLGGSALQRLHRRRRVAYEVLVFRKQ
jgi:SAM-dependent methyltransferase